LKRENILKLSPTGDLLDHIKKLRDDAVAQAPEMIPLKEHDIHFTLVKDNVRQVPDHLNPGTPIPPTPLTFASPQVASETKPDGSFKKSIFVRVHEQEALNSLVVNVIGGPSPDTRRVYHVTLATLTGNSRGAVSYPDPHSPNLNDQEP
jgi:hypothetical protein